MIIQDPYYNRAEVSNSDLIALKKYFMNEDQIRDYSEAYRFGNLVDAMITEPSRCNHLTRSIVIGPSSIPGIDEVDTFSQQEWDTAYRMLNAFRNDETCAAYLKLSEGQKVLSRLMVIEFDGIDFELQVRCKWDLYMERLGHGADIKSTVATSQKQFEELIDYFNYDQQRAWYMDIAGAKRDMLIGISKVNHKIFKVPITMESNIYKAGRAKYQELAFMWWSLFHGVEVKQEVTA